MGRGRVGTQDPPPYFWVEKFKKRGISLIRDSGSAQFQDSDAKNRVLTSALKIAKYARLAQKMVRWGVGGPSPAPSGAKG